jgi:ATP-dependent Clp protease protease subunit
MGAVLLAGGKKGKRFCLEHARVMMHQVSAGFQGTAADIYVQAEEIFRIKKIINDVLVRHTGQTLERIEKDTDRDYWMSGEQAKEYGVVDEVLKPGAGITSE